MYSTANFNHLLLYQDQLITYSPKRTNPIKFNCPGLLGCRKEKSEGNVWRVGARIPREAGRLLTISELAELKDFKINYRTDNTKDEKFFTSQEGVEFELKPRVAGNIEGVDVNASIDINFTKENAIFFNAAECAFEVIENKYEPPQFPLRQATRFRSRPMRKYR